MANEPKFRPRSRKRIRYYKLSLAMGFMFLACAMALPLVIDRIRHSHEQVASIEQPLEVSHEVVPEIPRRSQTFSCRNYVYQRCSALNMAPSACAPAIEAANALPEGVSLEACRAAVEDRLRETGSVVQEDTYEEPDVLQAADTTQVVATAGPEIQENVAKEVIVPQPLRPSEGLSPSERAVLAERMRVLVEEIQRAQTSRDYTMSPAALLARIEELRQIAQADGSEEAKAIYEAIRKQREPPTIHSEVGGSVEHTPYEGIRTTPEIEAAQRLLEKARRDAGLPPMVETRPPQPTSLSPSEVPTVQSLQP